MVLAECPICHKKQSVKNNDCECGEWLVKKQNKKQVRNPKTRFWIKFRLPDGKQRKEYVSMSITEAQDADGKRRVQKRENRIFDMLPESKMTFSELADWYTKLPDVQKIASFDRLQQALANFNVVFGKQEAGTIKPEQLKRYQSLRESQGYAPATIDMEISIAKSMVKEAFNNDKVDGRVLKAFMAIKRKLSKGDNARTEKLTVYQYLKLKETAAEHLKPFIVVAFNTGMRLGEIRTLEWKDVDRKSGFVRLPKEKTKTKNGRTIPINEHLEAVLASAKKVQALHPKHDFVFTYKGNPIGFTFDEEGKLVEGGRGGLKRSIQTAYKNAEIPYGMGTPGGQRFHDIRRSVKTFMVSAGVDKVYRDTIMGHSLKGMDVHYTVPSDEDLKGAMKLYTDWLNREIDAAKNEAEAEVAEGTA